MNLRFSLSGGERFAAIAALICAFLLPPSIHAVTPVAPSGASPAPGSLLPPSQFLPERAGFTSWRTLARVELVKKNNKLQPSFDNAITAIDGKNVRVEGFMIPLDIGDNQKRFLLVAAPPHCSFCLPAGPDSMIEIRANKGVKYRFEAVSLSGKFEVLKDDPAGLYYRLTDASSVEK
ncbi:MAG: DUF3299 domain-containing protein [Casimicrobium sp.]